MKKNYQVISGQDRRALAHWLTKNGQGLLPLVELVEGAQIALEELIDVTGRATIEAVLELSALQVAGEPQRGRRDGEVIWLSLLKTPKAAKSLEFWEVST